VVLSLDPDQAGRTAAARSSEVLVSEGFQVNVALLPDGQDPDVFIKTSGGRAYVERLKGSRPYLDFLLDRAAAGVDLGKPDGRKRFLEQMLAVAASIPDAADRDAFADRLAHKARITEGVVRDEIRKVAAQRKTTPPAVAIASTVRILPAEQGLLWALVHHPVEALGALAQLDAADLEGLLAAPIFRTAAGLGDVPGEHVLELLRERLTVAEQGLLERIGAEEAPMDGAGACVAALKRKRVEREQSEVQEAIDRLQREAGPSAMEMAALMRRKQTLSRQLDAMNG
jgi:DNA primase